MSRVELSSDPLSSRRLLSQKWGRPRHPPRTGGGGLDPRDGPKGSLQAGWAAAMLSWQERVEEHPTADEGLLALSASAWLQSMLRGPGSSSSREVRGRGLMLRRHRRPASLLAETAEQRNCLSSKTALRGRHSRTLWGCSERGSPLLDSQEGTVSPASVTQCRGTSQISTVNLRAFEACRAHRHTRFWTPSRAGVPFLQEVAWRADASLAPGPAFWCLLLGDPCPGVWAAQVTCS